MADNAKLTEFKMNIMIPYRPCCMGYFKSPAGELRQQDDNNWLAVKTGVVHNETDEYEKKIVSLRTCISAINARSRFKHKIMVVMDSDVFPNSNFMKQFDNVTVVKSDRPIADVMQTYEDARLRLAGSLQSGIDALNDDEEWVMYGYAADSLPSIDWDFHLMEAINRHGDGKVYAPMFIEGSQGHHPETVGVQLTSGYIWAERTSGLLNFPDPRADYFTIEDFDHFANVAREGNVGDQVENCGDRGYGHASAMLMKAKYIKKVGIRFGDWDMMGFAVDNALKRICDLQKVIITNAFILHPMCWHLEMRLPY